MIRPTSPNCLCSRPRTYLIYLDTNNLYGWAMIQPLPTGGFRFLPQDEIEALVPVGELSDDDEDGYINEVDLHYPQHLDDAHDDYPLAPSRRRSVVICIYPLSRQSFHSLHLEGNSLLILRDKVRYVVHYRNLKLYLQLGLIVIKVHSVEV